MVMLAGRNWTIADFLDREYAKNFPEEIFTDMLTEIALSIAEVETAAQYDGIAPGADGGYAKTASGLWARGDFSDDVMDAVNAGLAYSGITPSYNAGAKILTLTAATPPKYPFFKAKGGTQLTAPTTWVSLAFTNAQVLFDNFGAHSDAVNPTRITPGHTGTYRVYANVPNAAFSAGITIGARLIKNGVTVLTSMTQSTSATATSERGWYIGTNNVSTLLDEFDLTSPTDYVELQSYDAQGQHDPSNYLLLIEKIAELS